MITTAKDLKYIPEVLSESRYAISMYPDTMNIGKYSTKVTETDSGIILSTSLLSDYKAEDIKKLIGQLESVETIEVEHLTAHNEVAFVSVHKIISLYGWEIVSDASSNNIACIKGLYSSSVSFKNKED